MLINGVNIKNYNATLLDCNIENSEITTKAFWAEGSLTPAEQRQTIRWCNVSIELLIEEINNDNAEKQVSRILQLSKVAEIELENRTIKYKGTLESHGKEVIARGHYVLNLSFKCQSPFESEIINTFVNSANINLNSTMETPVIIELNPTENVAAVTITGLGEDITIKNLIKNSIVEIDGVKGLVTENGLNKWLDYDSWGFPKLIPGMNNIAVSSDKINATLKYSPRWI